MSPEDRRKAEAWWSRQLEKFPQLAQKYGTQVPIAQDGQIPRNVIADVQTARQAQTPLVGQGTPLPGQRQIIPPEPVNWREVGRDITSGIANLPTMGLNLIPGLNPQQATEDVTSKMFGVEPRPFDIPEDAGKLRTGLDPIMPTISGIGTIGSRFLDPLAAGAWQLGGELGMGDPHGQVSARKALRDAGYGPLESITGAYEQADIPWWQKIPVEIATSPEELIPGIGMYAGATRLAAKQLGRTATREVAEEAAPVVAREVAEEVPVVDEVVQPEVVQEPIQLGLTPREGAQYVFDETAPARIAEDIPVPQIQEVTSTAQSRIDQIIEDVTDTYDVRGMNITKVGTSPNKTNPEKAQENVREKFGQLITGNLNDAQAKRASDYISKQTGVDPEEIRRLAGEAGVQETFGPQLTPDQQLVETIAEQIDSAWNRRTEFSPEIETQLDNLITFRQEGKNQLLGFKSHYGRIRNQVAKEVGMSPAELEKYIDNMSQGTFPQPDPFPGGVPSPGWKVQQLVGDPQRQKEIDRFAIQLEMPLLPKGSKPKEVEERLALSKNEGYPIPADRPGTTNVSAGTQLARSSKDKLLTVVNDLESALRGLITPDEQAHILDKNAGTTLKDILSAAGAKTAVGKNLIVRYEGAVNARMNDIQIDAVQGDKLLEGLGFGARERGRYFSTERSFVLNQADIGTAADPGPIRVLYRALHGEVGGQEWSEATSELSKRMWITGENLPASVLAHPAMAPEKAAQREELFDFLREMTDMESAMRIDFDPKMGFIREDYFHRGWKPVEKLGDDVIRGNTQRLAETPSFAKARTTLRFWQLEEAGFEPLFWNPVHQAINSSQMGIKDRLQKELVEYMQNPLVNVAHAVGDQDEALQRLKSLYGMEFRVPKVGPAFEGKGFKVTEEMPAVEGVGQSVTQDVFREGMYAVPTGVADTLEQIWRGGTTNFNKVLNVSIPMTDKTYPVNLGKLIDAMVFIPKRIKLFASLFQITDFSRRLGIGSTHAIVDDVFRNMNLGMSPKESFESGVEVASGFKQHAGAAGKGWWNMWGDYFQGGKSAHYRNLLSSREITGIEAVLEGGGRQGQISWNNLVRNGLNVRDLTILPREDMLRIVDGISQNTNFPLKVGRYIKELEYSSRRGLFDRVYPAAIMTDVKYNLIPMAMKAYPNATDDQIMALVAKQANMKYSTLLRSQSALNQTAREILSRLAFSINENESLIRQMTGAFAGSDTRFWRTYWVSAGAFFMLAGNAIHMATGLVTEGKPKPLPVDRYVPFYRKEGLMPIGFKSRFLNPDIPLRTRSGERAMMDMLGQLDTFGRMLGGFEFISQRQSAPVGALRHLYSKTDFYGRDTDQFGWAGTALQFAYDVGVPIGMGEAVMGATSKFAGDVPLPSMGTFIGPDTTLGDILPVSEQSLGLGGMIAEATGENIKAQSVVDMETRMIKNTFPDGVPTGIDEKIKKIKPWAQIRMKDLDSDEKLKVLNDPANQHFIEELNRQSKEKADMDNIWHEEKQDRDEIKSGRMLAEDNLVNRYDTQANNNIAWDPKGFREEVSRISLEARARSEMVSDKYADNLQKKISNEPWSREKEAEEKVKRPIRWAEYRYYNLFKKHGTDFEQMDWDAFDADFAAERALWGTELTEKFDAVQRQKSAERHNPRVQQYYDAMDLLEQVGWFGKEEDDRLTEMITQYHDRMPKRKDGSGLREEWDKWLKGGTQERTRIERNSYYNVTIKLLKQERDRARQAILMSPEYGKQVDRAVIEWFGRVPSHQENLQLYYDLYEVMPRKMQLVR